MCMFILIQQGRWKSGGWGSHKEQQRSVGSFTAVERDLHCSVTAC
jgi:hypothetical protein